MLDNKVFSEIAYWLAAVFAITIKYVGTLNTH